MLKHVGDKWYVLDSSGKNVLGEHSSKEIAIGHLIAIETSKKKRSEMKESSILRFKNYLLEDIKLTAEYHEELNPKIWNDDK